MTGGLNQGAASTKYNWTAWVWIPSTTVDYQYGVPTKITLRTKNPGVTIVNYSDLHGDFANANVGAANGYEYYYDQDIHPVAISFTTNTATLRLINRASCSASVNDVTFTSSPTARAISAGEVDPIAANIALTCNAVLPAYTIKVSSPSGTNGDSTNGVIKSENDTIGYSLTWGDNQVASGDVQLDTTLTPATLPTQSSFQIPINVRPVSLVSSASQITSGPANSTINIELRFN